VGVLVGTTSPIDADPFVIVDGSNAAWVFAVSTSTNTVFGQRYLPGTMTPDGSPTAIASTATSILRSPSAAADATGAIWLFFVTDGGTPPAQIYAVRRDPVTQLWGQFRRLTGSIGSDAHSRSFAATAPNGVVWGIYKRLAGNTNELFFKQIVTAI